MGRFVQYGCGLTAPTTWENYDVSPTLRVQKVPLLGALIGLWAASGAAHERSASYSSWKFDGQGAAVTLIVAQQDAESLGSGAGAADSLLAYATSRLRLSADGQPWTICAYVVFAAVVSAISAWWIGANANRHVETVQSELATART